MDGADTESSESDEENVGTEGIEDGLALERGDCCD